MADESSAAAVVYCEVCTMPLEYCEFDPRVERCKEWMKEAHPVAFNRLFVEGVAEGAGDAASASAAASAKPVKAARIKETGKRKYKTDEVLIKTVQRNKRKYVTHVEGLEAYTDNMKALAKKLGKRFSCGSSVSELATGGHEIIIQGDVSYDMAEFLVEKHEVPKGKVFFFNKGKKSLAL